MAKRGLNCLPLLISEIDLPVQKRGYLYKTKRPCGALNTKEEYPKLVKPINQTTYHHPSSLFSVGATAVY